MAILITGGCGLLGQRLAKKILQELPDASDSEVAVIGRELILLDKTIPETAQQIPGAQYVAGDILDQPLLEGILTRDIKCIYHLAAILSGGAEADYDLGMKVNLDGTRALLNACRKAGHCPRLIFASSVAVFGSSPSAAAAEFTESSAPTPLSSYGAQKAMCELLIADATRRGFVDGVCLRLPTVTVRPGRPNSAASSFVSSIIREPLQGHPAVCPVEPRLPLWIQSPRLVVQNLLHARTVNLEGCPRVITLPGITSTPKEMVQALQDVGGDTNLVEWRRDPVIQGILGSWPGFIHTPTALSLGFRQDRSVEAIVQAFIEDDLQN